MRTVYEYAVIRVVPRVDREEFINVGVLVYREADEKLQAAIELDERRLSGLFPQADLACVREHLAGLLQVCRGGSDAGPLAEMPPRERFRWLTSPRSTILQTSPAHGGLTEDIDALLEHLLERLVRT